MLTLRPYQSEAVNAVYRHLRERDDNPVIVLPTAAGKTPCLATICRDVVERWNGRVLVISHVEELLQQPVTWSGSHVNADGKKNWVDVATSGVEEESES